MSERPQTAMAAAMKRAGLNVAEARLRQLAFDALKKHHRNISRALPTFESSVEDDPELIREALLHYLRHINHDLPVPGLKNLGDHHADAGGGNGGAGLSRRDNHLQAARPVREPNEGQRAAAAAVAKTIAATIFDRVKTSDNTPWGDVGAHELDGMDRDGAIARRAKSKLGVLTNEQRFKTLRELLTPAEFEEILNSVREQSHGT